MYNEKEKLSLHPHDDLLGHLKPLYPRKYTWRLWFNSQWHHTKILPLLQSSWTSAWAPTPPSWTSFQQRFQPVGQPVGCHRWPSAQSCPGEFGNGRRAWVIKESVKQVFVKGVSCNFQAKCAINKDNKVTLQLFGFFYLTLQLMLLIIVPLFPLYCQWALSTNSKKNLFFFYPKSVPAGLFCSSRLMPLQ